VHIWTAEFHLAVLMFDINEQFQCNNLTIV